MSSIAERLDSIKAALPSGVELAAVSKFHPVEALMEAYRAGQRVFCESRAAELAIKAEALPSDIEWHFIGHLQTNKVKTVVPWVSVIQSIDSERLLRAVDAEASKIGRRVKVLLQVHVAAEETKTGLTPDELIALASDASSLQSSEIAGVMGMATNTDDESRIEADFRAIADVAGRLRGLIPGAATLSMGMSHDYGIAVKCGSNMVRIGTFIFGEREY